MAYEKAIIWDVARSKAIAYLNGEPVCEAPSFADAEDALNELIAELERMDAQEEAAPAA